MEFEVPLESVADYIVLLDLSGTGALDRPGLVLVCIIPPTDDWKNCPGADPFGSSCIQAFQSYLIGSSKIEV